MQSALDNILELYQETVADLGMFKYEYQNKMLEIKSTDDLQSSRLNSIESLDKTQNERLNKIEALNELQSTHLTQHDEALSNQAVDLSSTAEAIRREESERAAEQQKVDEAQTAALNAAKDAQAIKDQEQDTAFENYKASQKAEQDAYKKAQEEIDSIQNAAIKKAEEWQDENWKDDDGKELSLQEYISKMVAKELEDIGTVNSTIDAKEKALADRLTTAETALSETQEKNKQLENLLRVYAKGTSKPTVFSSFILKSNTNNVATGSPDLNDIFNLLNGFSANLDFTVEDDPNWRAPAYSELLFNGVVESSDRTYTGTVNSNLTVQHRNTLTERVSPIKTIRFVDPVEPVNPTDVSWLRTQDPDGSGILKWSSHFTELVTAAITQNNNQYGWSNSNIQYNVEYSSDSKDWTQVSAPYNLSEMFGSDSQINLRVKYKVYDIIGNSKEFIINLGTIKAANVRRPVTKYRILNITTNNNFHEIISINASTKSSLTEAFTGSFTIKDTFFGSEYTAEITSMYNIRANGVVFTCPGIQNTQGAYEFSNGAVGECFSVTIQEVPDTDWCTVD